MINGAQKQNSNRRRSNSLDKQTYEYFYPNNELRNRTMEENSKDFYKPRIIKHTSISQKKVHIPNIILLLVKIAKLLVLELVLVIMSKKNMYLRKKSKLLKIINMLKI